MTRVVLVSPFGATIQAQEEQVDTLLAAGWVRARTSRRADTGTTPVQPQAAQPQQQPAQPRPAGTDIR